MPLNVCKLKCGLRSAFFAILTGVAITLFLSTTVQAGVYHSYMNTYVLDSGGGGKTTVSSTVVLQISGLKETQEPTSSVSSNRCMKTYTNAKGIWGDTITVTVIGSSTHPECVGLMVNTASTYLIDDSTCATDDGSGELKKSWTINTSGYDGPLTFVASNYTSEIGGCGSSPLDFGDPGIRYRVEGTYEPQDSGAGNGTPEDNPDTVMDGGDKGHGPAVCSIDGTGLPRWWVNTANFGLVVSDTEFSSAGLGVPVSMTRIWNSASGDNGGNGMFGKGWNFAYGVLLTSDGTKYGEADIAKGSGQKRSYDPDRASVIENNGTTTVTFEYSYNSPGDFDLLKGVFTDDPKTSYYLLTEKKTKNVWRFDHMGDSDDPDTEEDDLSVVHYYRPVSITDRHSNAVTLKYNAKNQLITIFDASNRGTSFVYADDKCVSMTGPSGHTASYTYDGADRLTQTVDFIGTGSTYAYNGDGLITSINAAGKTTTFEYDESGGWKHVAKMTDAAGRVTTYEGSFSGTSGKLHLDIVDPLGVKRVYSNQGGKTTRVFSWSGLEQTFKKEYNGLGLPTLVTLRDGATIGYEYDARGNITKTTHPDGTTTTFTYDDDDNALTQTDALGKTITNTYDEKGNLLSSTTPMGLTTQYSYNAKGQVITTTFSDGTQETFNYDEYGNVSSLTDAAANVYSFGYEPAGLFPSFVKKPGGAITRYQTDANKRVTGITYPNGTTSSFTYDCCAQVSETNAAGATWTTTRDVMLNPLTETDPLDRTLTYTYSQGDRLATVTTPLGRAMTMEYYTDSYNLLKKKTWPDGSSVSYKYDKHNNLIRVSNKLGKSTTMEYDAMGRLLKTTDPLGQSETFTYDAMGRQTSMTNARGQVVSSSFNDDGRVIEVKHDNTVAVGFTYNNGGYMTSHTDVTGTTKYTYDAIGRNTGIEYPVGGSLEVTYTADSDISRFKYPNEVSVEYTYDGLGRPTRVAFDDQTVDFEYNAVGQVVKETRSNGVVSTYTYDAANQITALKHDKGGNAMADLSFTWDQDARLTQESGTWTKSPEAVGESLTGTFDNNDSLTKWGEADGSSDQDGNLTSLGDARDLKVEYDLLNRPVSLTAKGVTRTYAYNAQGYRTRVVKNGSTTNMHHGPNGRMIFETDSIGNVTAMNVFYGGLLLARKQGSTHWDFPLRDKTSHVVGLTDENGALGATFAYTPFGRKLSSESSEWPYTYVGALGVRDEGDGIYFMTHRYYDSETGRFLQRDPLGMVDDVNLYLYGGNNPISQVDPNGTSVTLIAAVGAIGVFTGVVTGGVAWLNEHRAMKLEKQLSKLSPALQEYAKSRLEAHKEEREQLFRDRKSGKLKALAALNAMDRIKELLQKDKYIRSRLYPIQKRGDVQMKRYIAQGRAAGIAFGTAIYDVVAGVFIDKACGALKTGEVAAALIDLTVTTLRNTEPISDSAKNMKSEALTLWKHMTH